MRFDAVCFDCDSTLSQLEGVDELARHCGVLDAVAAMTADAMNGRLALEAVYGQRLQLIKPNAAAIDWLAQRYLETLVDGVAETIACLQQAQVPVFIISGGLRQAILPLAAQLAIPEERVFAVDVLFDADGQYLDFDRQSPLASSGGKARICRKLRMQYRELALVGDGQTDLEAQQAGAFMIGFGGVVKRPQVMAQADCFVDGPALTAVLPHLQSSGVAS